MFSVHSHYLQVEAWRLRDLSPRRTPQGEPRARTGLATLSSCGVSLEAQWSSNLSRWALGMLRQLQTQVKFPGH